MKKSLEERLKSLEARMARLEGGKDTPAMTRAEKVFCDIGMAHMLFHIGDTLRRDPCTDKFDDFLQRLFGNVATPEMRQACAGKLYDFGAELLKKTEKEYRGK